jgi:outer membrane receptor protein involved in Fe transport
MRLFLFRGVFVTLLSLLSAANLSVAVLQAQSEVGTATLNGTILDPSGSAVSAAKVSAKNQLTGFTRSVDTTEAGLYNLVRLPVGIYTLTVEAQGFKRVERADIPLNVGAVATVDLQLQVGQLSESVSVSADAPVVETTRTQTSTTVNQKLVSDLPINGRNFLDFTILSPGVVRDPRGGDLSFGGQRGTSNSLLIDGSDSNNLFFGQSSGRQGVRNPYSISQDAVQEFQVNTNGYGAEIGRAGGGVINVITKSGTNDLHGTVFYFVRNDAFNANNSFFKSINRARLPYKIHQFGANLGGPIVKDKLFFFANYDGQRFSEPIPVFPTPGTTPAATDSDGQAALRALQPFFTSYSRGLDNNVFLGKGDWIISGSQTLNVRYNLNRFVGRNFENGGNQRAPEATGDSKVNTDSVAVAYTKLFGGSTVLDLRYNYVSDRQPGEANSNNPEVTVRQNGLNVITFGRNNFSPRFTNTVRNQVIGTLSRTWGKHTFKFGGDFNRDNIDNFFPGQFAGVFVFNSLADFQLRRPAQFSQALAGPGTNGALTTPNQTEFAAFAQDAWRVTDRLTLNLGLRLDFFKTDSNTVDNPNEQFRATGLRTSVIPTDYNNVAGRFGFAYRLTKSDRMVLRGGAGMFYGRIPAILLGTVHSQNGLQVQSFTFNAPNIPVTYPNILTAVPTGAARVVNIFATEPNLKNPQTNQWNVNLETRLLKDMSLTVGYLGVRGQNLTRSRDINLFPYQIQTGVIAGGGTIQFERRPPNRPNPAFGRITLVESGGDSWYNGVFFQVTKRFGQDFQVLASYTYSRVEDTAPDATAVLPANAGDDAKIAQDTLQPNRDRGFGNANIPHRFVFSGVWDIRLARNLNNRAAKAILNGWQLSSIIQAQSGFPYNERVSIDLTGDGNLANDRTPFVDRNTQKLPSWTTVDMRVSRDIPIYKERVKVRLAGEAFNLLNKTNISGVNTVRWNVAAGTPFTFTPNAAFQRPSSTFDPRILQISAKIIW